MASYRGARSGVVNDLVMLDRIDEDSILDSLRRRHGAQEIYTWVGETLISVNPYQQIGGLYGQNVMRNYLRKKDHQNPPHAYAVAERAYRSMQLDASNECIVITGESGAGKTEASKTCMNYIAFLASRSKHVQRVKEQLLETNPLLEAFGNAKTRRNDNSSRFGKYFEILFKFNDPEGGRISQFLLEKNRVTYQQEGERNFHVFYQILTDSGLCRELGLSSSVNDYRYFSDPRSAQVRTVNDSADFQAMKKAMGWVGIQGHDQVAIFRVLGGILHLGNIEFETGRSNHRGGASEVTNMQSARMAAQLLGFNENDLCNALTHKAVRSGVETVYTSLNVQMAQFARDSLAKSLYGKLFDWIVQRANETIHCEQFSTSIGVLDIYGFEILGVNGFEQLCINHTNERLHQLFIELTLRKEQEEYKREGIAWTKVEFFDNLPICQLIESGRGLYALIDEESIFPQATETTLMNKLAQNVNDPYFRSDQRRGGHTRFEITHYAGVVTYDTTGMLDSNKDTLNINLVELCNYSQNQIVYSLLQDHPSAGNGRDRNQRPPTTCQQYKKQVADLMETLKQCSQHYIRCIKPNDRKSAGLFEDGMSLEQIRYLGLLENVKVRRAGYAFRMDFEEFMAKYKPTLLGSPEFQPDARSGVQQIMNDNGMRGYEMGRTKIFIKDAKTILDIEDKRKAFMDKCASFMPPDDGLIWADKVNAFTSKFQRTQLYFVVGGNGFYWFSGQGQVEHFIPMEKCEHLSYNKEQGWMVVSSTYPGRKLEDPPVTLNFLTENIYASEIENVVELVKRMGFEIETSSTTFVPQDAQDPEMYKENQRMIQKGAIVLPQGSGRGGVGSLACSVDVFKGYFSALSKIFKKGDRQLPPPPMPKAGSRYGTNPPPMPKRTKQNTALAAAPQFESSYSSNTNSRWGEEDNYGGSPSPSATTTSRWNQGGGYDSSPSATSNQWNQGGGYDNNSSSSTTSRWNQGGGYGNASSASSSSSTTSRWNQGGGSSNNNSSSTQNRWNQGGSSNNNSSTTSRWNQGGGSSKPRGNDNSWIKGNNNRAGGSSNTNNRWNQGGGSSNTGNRWQNNNNSQWKNQASNAGYAGTRYY